MMRETKSGFMIATAAAAIALSACGAAADGTRSENPQIIELVESLNNSCADLEDSANHDACVNLYRETAAGISETMLSSVALNTRGSPVDANSLRSQLSHSCMRSFVNLPEREEDAGLPDEPTSQALALCNSALTSAFRRLDTMISEENRTVIEEKISVMAQLPDCFAPTSFEAVNERQQAIANGEEPEAITCNIEIPVIEASMEAEPG